MSSKDEKAREPGVHAFARTSYLSDAMCVSDDLDLTVHRTFTLQTIDVGRVL